MKIIYRWTLLLTLILPVVTISCSSDDDDNVTTIDQVEKASIKLNTDSLKIAVDSNSIFEIMDGGGDYKAFASNPDIVTVQSDGNKITVSALAYGSTTVVISDQNNQYKLLPVTSYYDVISIGQQELNLRLPIGWDKTFNINIIKGNPGYEVSTKSDIMDVSIKDNQLIIHAFNEGEAVATLKDNYGLSTDIPVKIENTTVPYTDDELVSLKENNSKRIAYGDIEYNTVNRSYFNYTNTYNNGVYVMGFYYNSNYSYQVTIPANLETGDKEGVTVYYKWRTLLCDNLPVDCKIIKNDGDNVWGYFSKVIDGKLQFGYFCMPLP